jgi:hypothetical protein
MISEWERGVNPFNVNFTKDHWDSIIISLAVQFRTTVIITNTQDETIQVLYEILIKDLKGEHYISPCNKTPKPASLREQQQYLLSGLADTGDKSTLDLLQQFGTPMEVFKVLCNLVVEYTKGGNPKKPKDAPAGIGPLYILKNQELLLTNTFIKKEEKVINDVDKK